jgi:3-methyladenine DNA glycosylase/8-oxoguanine DNA glycosylase
MEELEKLEPDEARNMLLELPGIGDYSADIINPHGGFPIDAWSVEVFGKLFYGQEPIDKRKAIEGIKKEGLHRWGKWSWMAFFYVVQDLENLSKKLNMSLRLK